MDDSLNIPVQHYYQQQDFMTDQTHLHGLGSTLESINNVMDPTNTNGDAGMAQHQQAFHNSHLLQLHHQQMQQQQQQQQHQQQQHQQQHPFGHQDINTVNDQLHQLPDDHVRDQQEGLVSEQSMEQQTSTDQPYYVNAKQYHRILKRRIARAKLEEHLKIQRVRKPYLHESRHKHAMRRPRGQGGRFLTAAEIAELEKKEREKENGKELEKDKEPEKDKENGVELEKVPGADAVKNINGTVDDTNTNDDIKGSGYVDNNTAVNSSTENNNTETNNDNRSASNNELPHSAESKPNIKQETPLEYPK